MEKLPLNMIFSWLSGANQYIIQSEVFLPIYLGIIRIKTQPRREKEAQNGI